MVTGQWALLAFRLPREPSTPRVALWRALRRLGAVQILDGLVGLPADARTREQLEWLADEVVQSGGEATVWLARPGTAAQERAMVVRMQAAVAADYDRIAEAARAAPPGSGRRTLGRLRREMRRARRRDYFRAPERDAAGTAIADLARRIEELAA